MQIAGISIQPDRGAVYPVAEPTMMDYHVICTVPQAVDLELGDTIEYEEGGANFGWFVKKCQVADWSVKSRMTDMFIENGDVYVDGKLIGHTCISFGSLVPLVPIDDPEWPDGVIEDVLDAEFIGD